MVDKKNKKGIPKSAKSFLQSISDQVQIAWHGVNDSINLSRFLGSPIVYAEVDVRRHPESGRLMLRHDSFLKTPKKRGEKILYLDDALDALQSEDRGVKIDFKESGATLVDTLKLIESMQFPEEKLWFNANLKILGYSAARMISEKFPSAALQCPVDTLLPVFKHGFLLSPVLVRVIKSLGINRLSLRQDHPGLKSLVEMFNRYGIECNIYDLVTKEDLESSLDLSPASITSDFFIPEWGLHGRGSGQLGIYHCD